MITNNYRDYCILDGERIYFFYQVYRYLDSNNLYTTFSPSLDVFGYDTSPERSEQLMLAMLSFLYEEHDPVPDLKRLAWSVVELEDNIINRLSVGSLINTIEKFNYDSDNIYQPSNLSSVKDSYVSWRRYTQQEYFYHPLVVAYRDLKSEDFIF